MKTRHVPMTNGKLVQTATQLPSTRRKHRVPAECSEEQALSELRGTDYSGLIHDSGSSHQVTLTELFEGKQKQQKLETKQMRSRSWKPYLLTRILKMFLSHTVGPLLGPRQGKRG